MKGERMKRYREDSFGPISSDFVESPDGEWVKYQDCARLAKENEELKEQLKEVRAIAEHAEKYHRNDGCKCISRILKATRCLDKGGD